MIVTKMPYLASCPDCDGKTMKDMLITYQIPYGLEEDKVLLKVTHWAEVCSNIHCQCILIDWRGQEARDEVVKQYLIRKELSREISTEAHTFPQ